MRTTESRSIETFRRYVDGILTTNRKSPSAFSMPILRRWGQRGYPSSINPAVYFWCLSGSTLDLSRATYCSHAIPPLSSLFVSGLFENNHSSRLSRDGPSFPIPLPHPQNARFLGDATPATQLHHTPSARPTLTRVPLSYDSQNP